MRIFVYEHLTGGGELGREVAALRPLLPEAAAMLRCTAADFAKLPGVVVERLRDARLPADPRNEVPQPMPRCVGTVAEHTAAFDELAASCDYVLLIAPETDGVLTSLARRVEQLGGKLLSPSSEFCAWASDKSSVAAALHSKEAPVPVGLRLAVDDPWPDDFPFPAVLKPNDGCGAQHTYFVPGPGDDRRSAEHAVWRIEEFIPGEAVSVPFIAGPNRNLMLCPGRQDVRCDGRFKYLGGACPLTDDLVERVFHLMQRCEAAIPGFRGYIGVDAVLGAAADGSGDYLLEINPRITTSYVGQREICRENLAGVMLELAAGGTPSITRRLGSLSFDLDGTVVRRLEESS